MPEAPDERVEEIIDDIAGLPTLPSILENLNKLMMNPDTSANDVAELIQKDPAITSKILRVVNSSFYGFPRRIKTITHAIVILGFNTVKSIVLSTSIFEMFGEDEQEGGLFNHREFWRHSIGCGAAARVISQKTDLSTEGEEFFIAGLLHDLGKIVLDQHLEEEFGKVLNYTREHDCLIVEAEEEVLDITHAELAAWLFDEWNLSESIIECAQYHHHPSRASDHQEAASIVHLADLVARTLMIGNGGDQRIPEISDFAWNMLDIPIGSMDRIYAETEQEVENSKVFLDFIS